MMSRRGASKTVRVAGPCWLVLALLLALVLVGHDLVMSSPWVHATLEPASPHRHQSTLHSDGMSAARLAGVVSTHDGASQCLAIHVVRAPSSLTLEANADNGLGLADTCMLVARDQVVPGSPTSPLPAGTRRALLQVYLI